MAGSTAKKSTMPKRAERIRASMSGSNSMLTTGKKRTGTNEQDNLLMTNKFEETPFNQNGFAELPNTQPRTSIFNVDEYNNMLKDPF